MAGKAVHLVDGRGDGLLEQLGVRVTVGELLNRERLERQRAEAVGCLDDEGGGGAAITDGGAPGRMPPPVPWYLPFSALR